MRATTRTVDCRLRITAKKPVAPMHYVDLMYGVQNIAELVAEHAMISLVKKGWSR